MRTAWKRWRWPLLKGALGLAILTAIGSKFYIDLSRLDWTTLTLRSEWLVLSSVLYLLGLLPSAWYWHHLLRVFGQRPRRLTVLRAYFMGHMGKYVPGKAWALLLRGNFVRGPHTRFGVAIISSFYEVLTTMASGALLAALIFAFDPPEVPGLGWHPLLTGLLLLAACGVPLLPVVFNFIVGRMAARFQQVESFQLPPLRAGTLLLGLAATGVGWLILGLSVWALTHGVMREPPAWSIAAWLRCTGSIGLALVAGFVIVFLPVGLGARELLLAQLLAFAHPEQATIEAMVIVLRLVWTAVEVIAAAVLICIRERRVTPAADGRRDYGVPMIPPPVGGGRGDLHS
jgi:uncharacterized membrane protein YbhN (UPF0104 family)